MSKEDFDKKRDNFTGLFGVIAAAAGSAIGLGNFWRFPYVLGDNGGGAFLLIYLIFVFAICVPVMLSELLIGRKAQLSVFGAFNKLAPGTWWPVIGIMGVAASFMILSFYAVVAGWIFEYCLYAFGNRFAGMSQNDLNSLFATLTKDSLRPLVFALIFMVLTAIIVRSGIKKGIERYSKVLMPLLLIIVLILCIKSLSLEGASEGLKFLFKPDFNAITGDTIIIALGQAFFSLSLGMGVMATYGSYVKKTESLGKISVFVSLSDVLIAVLAGIAIFPAIFAFGMEPGAGSLEGPGLVFMILPGIFNQIAGGHFFAIIFFVLLVIAALTSSISLMEVVVSYFVEQLKLKRGKATLLATISMSVLAALASIDSSFFNFFEYTSSNILLPLGGFLIVIFVGWFLGKDVVREELEADGRVAFYFRLFIPAIRFLAPIAIAFIFLNALGFITF